VSSGTSLLSAFSPDKHRNPSATGTRANETRLNYAGWSGLTPVGVINPLLRSRRDWDGSLAAPRPRQTLRRRLVSLTAQRIESAAAARIERICLLFPHELATDLFRQAQLESFHHNARQALGHARKEDPMPDEFTAKSHINYNGTSLPVSRVIGP
jgi:hypothetical protein